MQKLIFGALVGAYLVSSASHADPGRDLNQVIISGQSLALGALGAPALSTTPAENAFMFEGGLGSWGWDQLVPLQESHNETIASGFAITLAGLLTEQMRPSHTVGLSLSARGGTPIEKLDRAGGDPYRRYWRTIFSAWWMRQLAIQLQMTHRVQAVFWLQGEANSGAVIADYREKLITLKRDYEADFSAVGQEGPVPMLTYQTSSAHVYGEDASVAQAQLEASIAEENLFLVTPIYHLPYVDPLHLTNRGYRWLGAYFAKVYKQTVIDGYPWEPLRPLFASASENTIYITYHVPHPPLVLDSEAVSDPGQFGFRVLDEQGEVPLEQVSILQRETVVITLSREPIGNATVEYAYEDALGQPAGPATGARGNLRDSDPRTGVDQEPLYNWSVIFRIGINH